MNKLNEILKKKSSVREIIETQFQEIAKTEALRKQKEALELQKEEVEKTYKEEQELIYKNKIARKSKNKATIDNAINYGGQYAGKGALIGSFFIGLGGLRSCMLNYTYNDLLTDFNFFN